MNILYLCHSDPRDTSYGGAQRSHLLWRALQSIGQVYTLCLPDVLNHDDPHIHRLEFALPTGWRYWVDLPIMNLWNFFDPVAYPKALPFPFQFVKFPYQGVKFDVIVCRYTNLPSQMNLWRQGRLLVDIDDHPISLFRYSKMPQITRWKQPVALWLQKMRVRLLEHHMNGCWISNADDATRIDSSRPIVHLPNIPRFPDHQYDADAPRQPYLFTVGIMSWEPNYRGVDAFLRDVWPTICSRYPELHYKIVGRDAPAEMVARWQHLPHVEYLGFVDDLQSLYQHCLATVVPIDEGSGTCIKTLESLAHSRLCLSTPAGARGIPSHYSLLIYHDAEQFANALQQHVLPESQRRSLENEAHRFAQQHYSWEVFSQAVKQLIHSGQ